jgi:TrmH family RNA methyltransferase
VKLLTLARDLARRKARERQKLFVCEGVRAVEELLRSPLRVVGALVAPQLADAPRGAALAAALRTAGIAVEDVSAREFATAAETETPQGVLAVAEIPSHALGSLVHSDSLRLLILDALQDPGNVGTILRTSAALGADATISLPGTVDLWNTKVVRSAMGAHFTHPSTSCTWDELDAFLAAHGVSVWGADAAGEPIDSTPPPRRLALVVGNEGSGLTAPSRERAVRLVSLPIGAGVESLNVAVATGILLYQLRR